MTGFDPLARTEDDGAEQNDQWEVIVLDYDRFLQVIETIKRQFETDDIEISTTAVAQKMSEMYEVPHKEILLV